MGHEYNLYFLQHINLFKWHLDVDYFSTRQWLWSVIAVGTFASNHIFQRVYWCNLFFTQMWWNMNTFNILRHIIFPWLYGYVTYFFPATDGYRAWMQLHHIIFSKGYIDVTYFSTQMWLNMNTFYVLWHIIFSINYVGVNYFIPKHVHTETCCNGYC